jgi:PAS domain S-box-containing protein
MVDLEMMKLILDSWKDPFVFVDTEHIIRYMNKSAVAKYGKRWGNDLIGKSLLDCHKERSRQMIVEILDAMRVGEEERIISDNTRHRVYMRAVRDKDGQLIGYYERYEPPLRK